MSKRLNQPTRYNTPQETETKTGWRALPKRTRTWIIIGIIILLLIINRLITSCTPQEVIVVHTQEVPVTQIVEVTQLMVVTATPTETPVPTSTPNPTEVPPTPTPAEPGSIAKNVHLVQEQGDVQVVLERLLITDPNSDIGYKLRDDESYKGKSVYVQPVLVITNNSDQIVKISFVGDILIMANGEQISYNNFLNIFYPPEYSKEILPGATVMGPVWVGLKNSTWNQITSVTVRIPKFQADGKNITDDFIFRIPVENWEFEPLPDSLK